MIAYKDRPTLRQVIEMVPTATTIVGKGDEPTDVSAFLSSEDDFDLSVLNSKVMWTDSYDGYHVIDVEGMRHSLVLTYT
jgi:hypothetical protein